VHYQTASGTAQTIGFEPPSSASAGSTLPLTAAATSGLAVVFTSLTTSVCTVNGNQVTTLAAGICTIAADQVGDVGYWTPAPRETRSFAVTASADVPVPTWAMALLSLLLVAAAVSRSQRTT
jgi:hypothetical protein